MMFARKMMMMLVQLMVREKMMMWMEWRMEPKESPMPPEEAAVETGPMRTTKAMAEGKTAFFEDGERFPTLVQEMARLLQRTTRMM